MTSRFATSYFGNRILRHVINDMNGLRQNGFELRPVQFNPRTCRLEGEAFIKVQERKAQSVQLAVGPILGRTGKSNNVD